MTELVTDSTVSYVARSGSDRGHEVLAAVPNVRAATASEIASAERAGATAEARITRRLDSNSARETLFDSLESPIWDDIAERCLTCANCTMVCPTCFCTDLVDTTDLAGDHTERWRHWDSCFSLEYSHLGPGPHRESGASRYRQWLTHKLGSWIDQFGESGCVGCGRCITWCPVGIDLTAELPKFAAATKS